MKEKKNAQIFPLSFAVRDSHFSSKIKNIDISVSSKNYLNNLLLIFLYE